MFGKIRSWQWLVGVALLAAVEVVGLVAIEVVVTSPAQAQFGFPYQRSPRRTPGFFQDLFGPYTPPAEHYESRPRAQPREYDSSRAPAAKKPDPAAPAPTTNIVVMGDGMADWLAYGLEDAFSDAPEVGIVREGKLNSGLIRYEAKGELDWWHVARDTLAKSNANYVVMMLGLADRQNIRERDVAKPPEKDVKDKKDAKDKKEKDANKDSKNPSDAAKKDQPDDAERGAIVAPEPKAAPNGIIEFRSDRWAEVYARRIDDTIAALKSKGVPVFWVGLPSIRGAKSTSEVSYLNELYRARAERAGIVYIDVWDGFVDESGKYSNFGPDYEGQIRRLRSSDGVFFTKYGARKLAHYVEREIRRYMNNRALPMALPSGPIEPAPKSAVRPLAGPVVPLTVPTVNSEELAGGRTPQPANVDAIATEVLVRGEPVSAPPGRADDFAWPGGSKSAEPLASAPAAPPVAAAPSAPQIKPAIETKSAPELKKEPAEKTVQKEVKPKPLRPPLFKPRRPQDDDVPRPPAPIGRPNGPFGWLR